MVTKQVNLNIWNTNNVVVCANSGEVDCRYIEVSFKDEDQNNISLTNKSVTFYAKKPDNTTIFNYCTVDTVNNIATIELTSQTLSVPGVLECEFQIFDENNVLLKVSGLKIFVSESEDFSKAIESISESNVLTSVINETKGLSKNIGELDHLNTSEKNTVIGAINEVNSKTIPISQGGTGGVTATDARINLNIMEATTLYDNSNGTNGTITTSENLSKFSYLDIFFRANGSHFASQRIYEPNGKSLHLFSCTAYSPTSTVMAFTSIITFSGTSVTWNSDNDSFFAVNTSNKCTFEFSRGLYIYKIVGYSYWNLGGKNNGIN